MIVILATSSLKYMGSWCPTAISTLSVAAALALHSLLTYVFPPPCTESRTMAGGPPRVTAAPCPTHTHPHQHRDALFFEFVV